ncbi:MAG: FusB/FusC family EF-G-binding protein [Ectobacillus sp.]
MEPFIKSYQFNFIRVQTRNLVSGYSTVNDTDVLDALKYSSQDKVLSIFPNITEEQRALLNEILAVEEEMQADMFLAKLKPYVIPFKEVTDKTLKKLFPKVKKLKAPNFDDIDFKELSYFGWNDKGSDKKFMIADFDGKLIGIQGTFTPSNKKGICALCNRHEEVGMFLAEVKGSEQGTFIKRGNYICQDSQKCNHNLTTLDKLHGFIALLRK